MTDIRPLAAATIVLCTVAAGIIAMGAIYGRSEQAVAAFRTDVLPKLDRECRERTGSAFGSLRGRGSKDEWIVRCGTGSDAKEIRVAAAETAR